MKAYRCIREYSDLVAALRDRRVELGYSCFELDERAGFQDNYANKLENFDKKYGRNAGPVILPLWLEALGLALVVVKTDEPVKMRRDPQQLSLDLIGGRMHTPRTRRPQLKAPSLVAA